MFTILTIFQYKNEPDPLELVRGSRSGSRSGWAQKGINKEIFDSNTSSYDYSTGFELVFKGLGSTDTNLRDHIHYLNEFYQIAKSKTVGTSNRPSRDAERIQENTETQGEESKS